MKKTALIIAWMLASGLVQAAEPGKTYLFTIVHSNDLHGHFWHDNGSYGLAAQKTLIDGIRDQVARAGGHILVLNAGDSNTGVPESDIQDGEPMFRGMNAIGYDAMAVGNHEFDKPFSVLLKQKSWARFPLLSANLTVDGKRPFAQSAHFRLGGLDVAVFGLLTPDTAKFLAPARRAQVHVADPRTIAAQLVPALRRRADVVIALTHLGFYPGGQHGTLAPGDVSLARAVPGIDVIVGGHSHTVLCMAEADRLEGEHVAGAPCQPDWQHGSWIMQAGERGRYVGRADFSFRDGRLTLLNYRLLPVNPPYPATGDRIASDPVVERLLAPFQNKGRSWLSAEVGRLDGDLDGARERVRYRPTSLGRFLARVMQSRTGADLALINGGGIRDSLRAGPVSQRDLLRVLPFGGTLVTVELSGAELLQWLTFAAGLTPGSGGYAHLAGATLSVADGRLLAAEVGGTPLEPARRYRLVTTRFVADGGDGYPRLSDKPGFTDTGLVDVEVIKEFFLRHSPVVAAEYAG